MNLEKLFRIELDNSGAILDCREVEDSAKKPSGTHVRYVYALDSAGACDEVKRWYESYRLRRNLSAVARREETRNNGTCFGRRKGCVRETVPGKTLCPTCLEASNESSRESRRRRRAGEAIDIRKNQGGAVAVLEGIRNRDRRRAHALGGTIMRAVALRKFDQLGPELFRAWLASEIERYQRERPIDADSEAQAAE